MSPWPFVLSVPHAGLDIPPEVAALNRLPPEEIARDGDEGAAEIYLPLRERVAALVTTSIGRPFVDMNRAEDDFRKDGVVKTHTCWDVPVYAEPLDRGLATSLIDRYHRPYHASLREAAQGKQLGIDGHTMAAQGPPVGPDPGVVRPHVCLGNLRGQTCPMAWLEALAKRLEQTLTHDVALNEPFAGGYITRLQPGAIPWIQLELSRADWMPRADKSAALGEALDAFARDIAS